MRETALQQGVVADAVDGQRVALRTLFGLTFDDRPLDQIAASLVAAAQAREPRRVYFVNAHCANVAYREDAYYQLLARQPCVYADGIGLRLASRMAALPDRSGARSVALSHNVNGTDLFPILCSAAARAGVAVALLGAKPGTVAACVQNLARDYPDLKVAWQGHGYMSASEEREAIAQIAASNAGLLFVAKGVPLQEHWIEANAEELGVPVVFGVGALFDFVAGNVPRAPVLLRKLHLEWAYRLAQEPRRMFGRYVLGNPLFLYRCLRARFAHTLTSRQWRA